jgi:hypothetical protein
MKKKYVLRKCVNKYPMIVTAVPKFFLPSYLIANLYYRAEPESGSYPKFRPLADQHFPPLIISQLIHSDCPLS